MTELDKAINVIERLLAWGEHTGGWEADIWRDAAAFVARNNAKARREARNARKAERDRANSTW